MQTIDVSGGYSIQDINRRRKMAEALQSQGKQPVKDYTGAFIGILANSLGNYQGYKADEAEKDATSKLAEALSGGDAKKQAILQNLPLDAQQKVIADMLTKEADKPNLPTGYQLNPQTGQAELIPGVDSSFAKRGDPFGSLMPVFDPATGRMGFSSKADIASNPNLQPPAAAPNESEKLSAGFADRMAAANELMTGYEGKGVTTADPEQAAYSSIPLLGNFLVSKDYQQLKQAQDNWVRANLRKESGAVIATEEMEKERRTYFPVPGDSPEVIKQKAQARAITENAMKRNAGFNYKPSSEMQPAQDKPDLKAIKDKYGLQ